MDRMICAKIAGEERFLCYSVSVMFDMADKFGNIQNAMDIIQEDNRDGFEAVKWFAVKMANEGELCLRSAGHTPSAMVTESDITMRLSPFAYAELRDAVVKAIGAGYRTEIESSENEETDIGLEELRAKKNQAGACGQD